MALEGGFFSIKGNVLIVGIVVDKDAEAGKGLTQDLIPDLPAEPCSS
jgi:hypothetical protein